MKVLFVMRHSGYVRNFESTLRMLGDRGHAVRILFQNEGPHPLLDAGDVAQRICGQYPQFSRGVIPAREDTWGAAARDLRLTLDYLRYLTPRYATTPKLLARARRDARPEVVAGIERGLFANRAGRSLLSRRLRFEHRAIPTDPRIDGLLDAHRPDVLVVTPLIEPGARQAEYVRSARSLGIRTALCVASWDNLTNKGLIHGPVDMVAVWNEAMKREAVDLHGVPPERVVVTGAQPFDHWFDWKASTTRAEFCAKVGLPADAPYLLYVCSSKFIAPDEAQFVRSWLTELRRSGSDTLRRAGVLIRPHPQNADQWLDVDLSGGGPVVVWPPNGEVPSEDASRADYFDSIFHSAAVVGINTTAEIESAIVGRSVYTVLAPEFRETQEGTLHFAHLRRANGGLLHVGGSFADHFRQLDEALRNPGANDERCRKFVESFVRPFGIGEPATPRLVDALETLASRPTPQPERAPLLARFVRPKLARLGHRLQHEAFLKQEAKAAKKLARARKESRHEPEAAPARAHAKVSASWRGLAAGYRQLGYEHRVYFGRTVADCVPGELVQLLFEQGQPERLDYPDAEIYLRVTSRSEHNRLRGCSKEPFTIDWIHRCVGAGEVLYDIGANVGAYSLVAAMKPGGGARVFSFEPSYANLASLCANIVLNKASDQVTALPVALSNAAGLSVFALRVLEAGSARHTLGDAGAKDGPALYRQPVMTLRLDDLVERFGLPAPNHIKLDVDGGELAVLEGAAGALASPSLKSMLVEVSTSLSQDVTDVLAKHGLRLETKVNVQNKAGEYLVWYGVFTREARDAGIREVPFAFTAQ